MPTPSSTTSPRRARLTDYLHLNTKFPLRREYAGYLRWVADSFRDAVDYGQTATSLSVVDSPDGEVFRLETGTGRQYLGETVVIGTGRSPRIPEVFRRSPAGTVFHATRYLGALRRHEGRNLRVAVVGGSQSAIEIVLDSSAGPMSSRSSRSSAASASGSRDTSPYSSRCSSRSSSTTSIRSGGDEAAPARRAAVGELRGVRPGTSSTGSRACSTSTADGVRPAAPQAVLRGGRGRPGRRRGGEPAGAP
ncbi:SidA/IucD/PvdA family monooxygenase [Streptomyces thioluteus]|uniref:SidA/IucD/PvdA family monooxygenase n=1 Tax=Streptomyces thioluteus TaxID=66431 RepID=UPI0031EFC9F6